MAAQLKKEDHVEVKTVRGGLGEFSLYLDDRKVIDTNRFWYPSADKVVKKVRALLAE